MLEEPLNQLYQFLRTSFRAIGEAHRTNPRRHTSTPARLTWVQGNKQQTVRGRLVDISRAGAAVLTTAPPPDRARVRLRLAGREPTPWIEADVLGAEADSRTRYRVRLQFREPCPTYFLRVAVLGPVVPDDASEAGTLPAVEPLGLTVPSPPAPSAGSAS
jgi:hypothetical protein